MMLAEALAIVWPIFLCSLWLLWNGRRNSRRHREQIARFDYLIEEFDRERELKP